MKTHEEAQQYRHLKRRMIAKCDSNNTKWAGYYATLLGIGGNNPEQVIRNFFNDDLKRFNAEQMATIYNDLEDHHDVKPFTQCEAQQDVLKIVGKIGKISEKMQKHFDDVDELELSEVLPLIPESRELNSLAYLLAWRLEETRAQL